MAITVVLFDVGMRDGALHDMVCIPRPFSSSNSSTLMATPGTRGQVYTLDRTGDHDFAPADNPQCLFCQECRPDPSHFTGAAIHDRHLLAAESDAGARGIDGHVAAAYHGHPATRRMPIAQGDAAQEMDRIGHVRVVVLARKEQLESVMRSDGDEEYLMKWAYPCARART